MKPPVCEVCSRDFRGATGEGGLVKFADYEPIDRPGHPRGAGWFCGRHHAGAAAHAHLPMTEAVRAIRRVPAGIWIVVRGFRRLARSVRDAARGRTRTRAVGWLIVPLAVTLSVERGCGQAGLNASMLPGPVVTMGPDTTRVEGTVVVRHRGRAAAGIAFVSPITRKPHSWILFHVQPEDPEIGPPKQRVLGGFNASERMFAYSLGSCTGAICTHRFQVVLEWVAGTDPVVIPWSVEATAVDRTRNVVVEVPRLTMEGWGSGLRRSGDAVGFDQFHSTAAAEVVRHYAVTYRREFAGGVLRFMASPLHHEGNRLPQWLRVRDVLSGETAGLVGDGIAEMRLTAANCDADLCRKAIVLTASFDGPASRTPGAEWATDWAVRVDARSGLGRDARPAGPSDLVFAVVAQDLD